jgi:hypothetical protein
VPAAIVASAFDMLRAAAKPPSISDCTIPADVRAGSVCLNSLRAFVKWITASIMPPPELAATL